MSLSLLQNTSAQTVGKKQNIAGNSGDDDGLAGIIRTRDGRPVLTKVINGKEDISVSHLPAGTYYLKNDTTGEMKKMMIVK